MTRKNITIGGLLIIVGIGWGIALSSISIIARAPRALPLNLKLQAHRTLANSKVLLNKGDLKLSENLDGALRTKAEPDLLRGEWLTRSPVYELTTQLDEQRRASLPPRFNPGRLLNLTSPLEVKAGPTLHLEQMPGDKKPALPGVLNLT